MGDETETTEELSFETETTKRDFKHVKEEFEEERPQLQKATYHLALQNQEKDAKLKEAIDEVPSVEEMQQESFEWKALCVELANTKNELTNAKYELTICKNDLNIANSDYQRVHDELTIAKNDYEKVRDELYGLVSRYDEDVEHARDERRDEIEELRDTVKKTERAQELELRSLQGTVDKVINENHLLQHVLQRTCKRLKELEKTSLLVVDQEFFSNLFDE